MAQGEIRRFGERFLHREEGILPGPIVGGQAHEPVVHLMTTDAPVIGIGKDHQSRETTAKGRLDLPREHLALFVLALALRVGAEFAKDQRLGVRLHLEPGEVILEWPAMMQIDIETEEIDVLGPEELGGRIIRNRTEAVRILRPGDFHQLLDEVGDPADSAPADDIRRNLVDQAVGKYRRVPHAGPHDAPDGFARLVQSLR
jgi:hypothetical protein